MIEIKDVYEDPVIEDQRNETQLEQEPPETTFPEPEEATKSPIGYVLVVDYSTIPNCYVV